MNKSEVNSCGGNQVELGKTEYKRSSILLHLMGY